MDFPFERNYHIFRLRARTKKGFRLKKFGHLIICLRCFIALEGSRSVIWGLWLLYFKNRFRKSVAELTYGDPP